MYMCIDGGDFGQICLHSIFFLVILPAEFLHFFQSIVLCWTVEMEIVRPVKTLSTPAVLFAQNWTRWGHQLRVLWVRTNAGRDPSAAISELFLQEKDSGKKGNQNGNRPFWPWITNRKAPTTHILVRDVNDKTCIFSLLTLSRTHSAHFPPVHACLSDALFVLLHVCRVRPVRM